MSDTYRHHRAHAGGPADTRIVFIEVPVAGSPKVARTAKPGQYPSNQRQPWRPATRPPSKAERTARFLNSVARQDADIRRFMQESRRHAN